MALTSLWSHNIAQITYAAFVAAGNNHTIGIQNTIST